MICTYTLARFDDLVAAVTSVRTQDVTAHEIIVVVDHNPTLFARVRASLSDVIATPNSGPVGLSGGRNSGVAVATGEVVAFLDDDAIAPADWLRLLTAEYQDGHVVGVGGAAEPIWQTGRPTWFPPEFDWVVGCTYRGMPETSAPVRNFVGCNMSFRRALVETLGSFATDLGRIADLPVGCEETEFCIRALQQSRDNALLYLPTLRVQHRVPANRATWRYFRTRCFWEGRSKAHLARHVGVTRGLASERRYICRTLPAGVKHGLSDTLRHHDVTGFQRSISILAGLLFTSAGYLVGVLGERQGVRQRVNALLPPRLALRSPDAMLAIEDTGPIASGRTGARP